MDIHKPKPWHGWRELAKEVGTIVIGVLIALGAEQAVEWLHQRHEVEEARSAIRVELADDLTYAEITMVEDRCALGLGQVIIGWTKGGPRPQPAAMISPVFAFTIWDASQSGPVSHMPQAEKFGYARLYDTFRNEQSLANTFRGQATHLGRLGAIDSLTPAEARTMSQEVVEASNILSAGINNAEGVLHDAAKAGLHPKPIGPQLRAMLRDECRSGGLPAPDFDKPGP